MICINIPLPCYSEHCLGYGITIRAGKLLSLLLCNRLKVNLRFPIFPILLFVFLHLFRSLPEHDDENLKYMATMSILITILIQSYNVPCNIIDT